MEGEQYKGMVIVEKKAVRAVMTVAEAQEQFQKFQEFKVSVLTDEDKEPIKGKPYVRKTGWRKIGRLFGLSEEILSSRREVDPDGTKRWIYKVRVKSETGMFADAEMSCDTQEAFAWNDKEAYKLPFKERRYPKPESAIMAMAQTRAYNRAISDLVGGGESSAEEMSEIEVRQEPKNITPPRQPISNPADGKCGGCSGKISDKEYSYSMNRFHKPLCFNCQKAIRENPANESESESSIDDEDVVM